MQPVPLVENYEQVIGLECGEIAHLPPGWVLSENTEYQYQTTNRRVRAEVNRCNIDLGIWYYEVWDGRNFPNTGYLYEGECPTAYEAMRTVQPLANRVANSECQFPAPAPSQKTPIPDVTEHLEAIPFWREWLHRLLGI